MALAPQVVLFEEAGFKCQSRYANLIAFDVDIALLLKVGCSRGGAAGAAAVVERLLRRPALLVLVPRRRDRPAEAPACAPACPALPPSLLARPGAALGAGARRRHARDEAGHAQRAHACALLAVAGLVRRSLCPPGGKCFPPYHRPPSPAPPLPPPTQRCSERRGEAAAHAGLLLARLQRDDGAGAAHQVGLLPTQRRQRVCSTWPPALPASATSLLTTPFNLLCRLPPRLPACLARLASQLAVQPGGRGGGVAPERHLHAGALLPGHPARGAAHAGGALQGGLACWSLLVGRWVCCSRLVRELADSSVG